MFQTQCSKSLGIMGHDSDKEESAGMIKLNDGFLIISKK
jgi:hypothetical protein